MVGVPRSRGCSLCVKRRVKCDQARPGEHIPVCYRTNPSEPSLTSVGWSKACGNCVRYGAQCPGYDKNHKFVDGKHLVRARRARGKQAAKIDEAHFDLSTARDVGSNPATQPFAPLTNHHALARWSPNFSNYGGQVQTMWQLGIPGTLTEACAPFVYNMMGQLFSIHTREEVVFNAPWFSSLLNHLGTSPVLDSAMCAFMLQLLGKAKRDPADVTRSRDIYGQSLGALQRALNHPVAWRSTETLAATILCSIYEVREGFHPRLYALHVGAT